MKPLLKTFLLECPDRRVFDRYQLRARLFAENRERAVMVCGRDFPDKKWVVREMDGDQFEFVVGWLKRTPLAELHEEHMRISESITPEKKEKALAKYLKAREAVTKAQYAEHEAAQDLIRMNGRGYLRIDGVPHDPYYFERDGSTFVGYRPRKKK